MSTKYNADETDQVDHNVGQKLGETSKYKVNIINEKHIDIPAMGLVLEDQL